MTQLLHSFTRKDFRVDTFRSGGPGGQHQNKTDSGVRITHLDTGLVAESRESKHQVQNKKIAFHRLAKKLKEYYTELYKSERVKSFEVIRTYHAVDNRVTDHKSGKQMPYKTVMEKGLGDMIDARRESEME